MDSQMDTSPASPLSVHFALLLLAKRAAQIKRVSLKRNSRIFNTHAAP